MWSPWPFPGNDPLPQDCGSTLFCLVAFVSVLRRISDNFHLFTPVLRPRGTRSRSPGFFARRRKGYLTDSTVPRMNLFFLHKIENHIIKIR